MNVFSMENTASNESSRRHLIDHNIHCSDVILLLIDDLLASSAQCLTCLRIYIVTARTQW